MCVIFTGESQLALMLSLPCRMGGYGLSKPLLNARLKNSLREADLLWLENKLVVEYESNQHHATVESPGKDSTRRTKIELLGFRVITATNEQVTNYCLMDGLAHLIKSGARAAGNTGLQEMRGRGICGPREMRGYGGKAPKEKGRLKATLGSALV